MRWKAKLTHSDLTQGLNYIEVYTINYKSFLFYERILMSMEVCIPIY